MSDNKNARSPENFGRPRQPLLLATGDCVRSRPNAAISALFVKFSLEVRIVRLRSPLPKIIVNIGVLVVDKSCLAFLG